jgi:hypothetical protein
MAYPSSIKSFTFKRNNIDKVIADDVNLAYTEITEIERQLGGITTTSGGSAGVGVVKSDWGVGTFGTGITNWYSNDGLAARLKNIEAGLYQILITGSLGNITTGTITSGAINGTTISSNVINGTTIPTSSTLLTTTSTTSALTKIGALSGGVAGFVKIATDGTLTSSSASEFALKAGTTFTGKVILNNDIATAPLVIPSVSAYPNDGSVGAVEFYNNSLYFTPNNTSGQGSLPTSYFIGTSTADYSLANQSTIQNLFGKSLSLIATTLYHFDIYLIIAAATNNTRTIIFDIPGVTNVTTGYLSYTATVITNTSNGQGTISSSSSNTYVGARASDTTGTGSLSLLPATTSWYSLVIKITGQLYTNANQTNTFNPSATIALSGGVPGALSLRNGSYARIWQVGNRALTSGNISYSGSWA